VARSKTPTNQLMPPQPPMDQRPTNTSKQTYFSANPCKPTLGPTCQPPGQRGSRLEAKWVRPNRHWLPSSLACTWQLLITPQRQLQLLAPILPDRDHLTNAINTRGGAPNEDTPQVAHSLIPLLFSP
jgi:hypothetical protein